MRIVRRSLLPILLLAACHKAPPALVYQAVPVEKRDIVVSATASGAINPDTTVQIRSKASGEILNIPVSVGDVVQRGSPIVEVDPRIPANDVAQAVAALRVDSAQLTNANIQLKRQRELLAARAITQQDLETAQLAVAVANAALVRDQITYDNAEIALSDCHMLAPITGTVISMAVQRGTVISSATSSASGGTLILTMADLGLVQVRTWVDETDVGKLRVGQQATVTVAAFPNHPFKGEVLKIEPQGDTIQNVTMFPVDVRIDNRDGMLKPGMNADVNVLVGQALGVPAVPNAALRTDRDVASAGSVLGIAADALQQELATAKADFTRATEQAADSGPTAPLASPGGQPAGPGGGRGSGNRSGGNGGGGGSRGAGNPAGRSGRGGGGGAFGAGARYIVFTKRLDHIAPVYIQTGITDLDYSQVKAGALAVGDSVLLLPSASLVQQQAQLQQRMSQRAGLPGQATPSTGGGRGGGGGGRGGGRL